MSLERQIHRSGIRLTDISSECIRLRAEIQGTAQLLSGIIRTPREDKVWIKLHEAQNLLTEVITECQPIVTGAGEEPL